MGAGDVRPMGSRVIGTPLQPLDRAFTEINARELPLLKDVILDAALRAEDCGETCVTRGACPRCNHVFQHPVIERAFDEGIEFAACPSCGWRFSGVAYATHVDRLAVRKAGSSDPEHRHLADKTRFLYPSTRMTLGEQLRFAFKNRHTVDRVVLRQAIHELLHRCVCLSDAYPAIPESMNGPGGVVGFLRDPHDRFLLGAIANVAADADCVARTLLVEGRVSQGEFRHAAETEGLGISVPLTVQETNSFAPHLRGLALATLLWSRAYGTMRACPSAGPPPLVKQMLAWVIRKG